VPSYKDFNAALTSELNLTDKQSSPLQLRLRLLESLVVGTQENKKLPVPNLESLLTNPSLVVVDLTDPMMSGPEANSIFEVLLSMFLTISSSNGKLVVFDEAHKYLQTDGKDELSRSIISSVRQMRHHGLRVVISTQSPTTLPNEILDLASVALLHRFHARNWFTFLQTKYPLPESAYEDIMQLPTGHALVFHSSWSEEFKQNGADYINEVAVRARFTADGGISRTRSV
jgi:hypothetical protein